MDGLGMMLKAAGIDLPKMMQDFEQLKAGVEKTLQAINARLANLDAQQQKVIELLKETNHVLLADLQQHTTLLQELTAWKRKQEYLATEALSLHRQQPTVQNPPPPQPAEQSRPPQPQLVQPSPQPQP